MWWSVLILWSHINQSTVYETLRCVNIFWVHHETLAGQRTSAVEAVLRRMWPHACQTTCQCGLSDQISNVSRALRAVHLRLDRPAVFASSLVQRSEIQSQEVNSC